MNTGSRIRQRLIRPLRYRVYRRLLLTYLTMVIALVLLIGGTIAVIFSRHAAREALDYASDMMSQRVYSTRLLWEEMDALSGSMSTNSAIQRFLTMNTDDKVARYHALREMTNYKAAYPFVRNITAVNLTIGQQLSIVYYADDISLFSSGGARCFPSTLRAPNFLRADTEVLTFVYPIQLYSAEPTCGFVISIDQSHLHSLLNGEGSTALGSETLILDYQGNVVTRSGAAILSETPGDEPVIRQMLAAGAGRGTRLETIGGTRYMVSCCAFPSQEWMLISIQPAAALQNRFAATLLLTAAVLLILLLAACVIAALAARNAYKPIRTLVENVTGNDTQLSVDEISAISDTLDTMRDRSLAMQSALRRATVRSLLLNARQDAQTDGFEGSAFAVILIAAEAEDKADRLAGSLRAALSDICGTDCLRTEAGLITLLTLPGAAIPEALLITLEREISLARENGLKEAQAAVSDLVLQPGSIHQAYEQAQQILQYRFYDREEPVFTSAVLTAKATAPIPPETALTLLSVISAKDEAAAVRTVNELTALAAAHPPAYCREIVSVMLHSCVTSLSGSMEKEASAALLSRCSALTGLSRFEELREAAAACAADCCGLLRESESNRALQHSQRLIHQVTAYVDENYADPNLSLLSAAEQVQLSAGYLGRLFKQSTGRSFAEHLTAVRLSAACGLLTGTALPIAAIAEKVGMENPSYFTSLFKKAYGMSPSKYKELHAGGEDPD